MENEQRDKNQEDLLSKASAYTGIPKKHFYRRIIYSIIIFIIGGLIGNTLGYYQISFLNSINAQVGITATISPYIQKGFDADFLPLTVTNTGDKTIHNIKIGVSNPVLLEKKKNSEVYIIQSLEPHGGKYTLPYGNIDTINDFKRLSCSPYSPKPYASVSLIIGSNQTNTTTNLICSICNYTIFIFSDEINTSINSSYPCPYDLNLTLSSK